MANNFDDQIDDIATEELTEELRGIIIDEDPTKTNKLWFVAGLVTFSLAIFLGWFYFYTTHSEEVELRKRLVNRASVKKMLIEASLPIKSSTVRKIELKQAIKDLLTVAETPLRQGNNPTAPFISEKHTALVSVLDAWLRLELIKGFDDDDIDDSNFFRSQLARLGEHTLEYYENGLLNLIPLRQAASLERRMMELEYSPNVHDQETVASIQAQLEGIYEKESQSIVGIAFLLGKWYRYFNKNEEAIHCFEVGRQYVEGFRERGVFYPGRRPKDLGALWSEYTGCLEALAEYAFQDHRYREARSYLSRLFNTPKESQYFDDKSLTHARSLSDTQRLKSLQQDIATLEKAIEFPLELPSFPYFHVKDPIIKWDEWILLLQQAPHSTERDAITFVWENLPPTIQDELIRQRPSVPPSDTLKKALVQSCNTLIRDAAFHKKVVCDEQLLSEKSKLLLFREEEASFSKEDLTFLNRDILDLSFEEALDNPYILSDGTRLHSLLTPEQTEDLIGFYEERLSESDITPSARHALQEEIREIYNERILPTLHDLHAAIEHRVVQAKTQIHNAERSTKQQQMELEKIRQEIKALESTPGLDLSDLLKLKKQEELYERQQLQAHRLKSEASDVLDLAQGSLSNLSQNLQRRLAETKAQLGLLKEQQTLQSKRDRQVYKPPLVQIDKQIELNERYLKLLKELERTHGNEELTALDQEHRDLEANLLKLRSKSETLSGNDRERIDAEIQSLQERKHHIIKAFDELFTPLKTLVDSIASEESKVWEAEKVLKQTREEIFEIVGSERIPGSLKCMVQQRSQLLLLSPDKAGETTLHNEEIQHLTELISTTHGKLQVLLQKERAAKETLETFYPQLAQTGSMGESRSELEPLQRYLQEQDELITQYQLLWRKNALLEDIQGHEKSIVNNLRLISESLAETHDLSETQTQNVSRYMYDILHSKKRLKHLNRLLRTTITEVASFDGNFDSVSGKGYNLDITEMFQMEQQLGMSLSKYREAFQERQNLTVDLQEALKEKARYEEQKGVAIRERNQAAIDQLVPLVNEQEKHINSLIAQNMKSNQYLDELSREYTQNLEVMQNYRHKAVPEISSTEKHIEELSARISKNGEALNDLGDSIITMKEKIEKSITGLNIEDLGNLADVVERQEKILHHLYEVRDLRQGEYYYQSKALWLIGRSYYDQSQLEDIQALEDSTHITARVLEDERRNGAPILRDYDQDYAYSDDLFGEEGAAVDQNYANKEIWKDFLEKSAIEIFKDELTQYTQSIIEHPDQHEVLSNSMQKDIEAFVAKSRFFAGEIYMKRALRLLRDSREEASKNEDAHISLTSAEQAFYHFLDFANSPHLLDKEGRRQLTEELIGSPEFPTKKRQMFNFVDEARLFLGIIAHLKGDTTESISRFKSLLTAIDPEAHQQLEAEIARGKNDASRSKHYYFEAHASPHIVSLLSSRPLAHEVLYRLGKSYGKLANESFHLALAADAPPGSPLAYASPNQSNEAHLERFYTYANHAVAYYSLLVNTQNYSTYRTAATMQRALMLKLLGEFEGARNDLTKILGDPDNVGGSLDPQSMTAKGDLPGEINPGYAYVAFELGKLFLENKEFEAAAAAFLKAKQSDPEQIYVLQARINYAQALKESGQWAMAAYFLGELIKEKEELSVLPKRYYHPDLYIDLATVQRNLGDLRNALDSLDKVLTHAPRQLVRQGRLDLSNPYGMALLKSDYRDIIRPLAESRLLAAELSLSLRDYPEAIRSYHDAELLFEAMPWREDRIFRLRPREEYEVYRDQNALEARWGQLRTEALSLLYSTFANYRRSVEFNSKSKEDHSTQAAELRTIMRETLRQAREQEDSYADVLKKITAFYHKEHALLPEVISQQSIQERRNQDRRQGGQKHLRYTALKRLRDASLATTQESGAAQFVKELLSNFSVESVEDKILNDFVLDYAANLDMTVRDQEAMVLGKSNLENLFAIENSGERLDDFRNKLLGWLQGQMEGTGLDDIFIPLTPQGKILEEVALFRVSLLAHRTDYDSYADLNAIKDHFVSLRNAHPTRVQQADIVWQMVEIACSTARYLKDWEKVEKCTRYLIVNHAEAPMGTQQPIEQHRIFLAEALIEMASKGFEEAAFIFKEGEKALLEVESHERMAEAKKILTTLSESEGQDTGSISSRIRAKQILSEIGV